MLDTDEVDQAFRAATADVHEAPVRANRVARLVRRKRLLALAGLLLGGIGLTVVLAGGLLAGKTAVDPGFNPPFFSEASSSVSFGEPEVARGHTQLDDFLSDAELAAAGVGPAERSREGLVFRAKLRVVGHRSRPLEATWALRPVGSGRRLAAPTFPDVSVIRPGSEDETRTVRVWIGPPDRSGRYVVDFELSDRRGKLVEQSRSDPFLILAADFFAPYRTPAYTAQLPAEWPFEQDYEEVAGRYVSKKTGPAGVSVLIDTTPDASGNPAKSARFLESDLKADPGYERLKFQPARLGPGKVFEWSFELDGRRKTDIFFYRGGDGFAVLAEGPPARFAMIRAVAREVARSVKPRRPVSSAR